MAKITYLTTGEVFEVKDQSDLLQAYQINPNLPLKFGCTLGHCGTCAFKITSGEINLTQATKQENSTLKHKLEEGYRLACQCSILGDIAIN